MGLLLPKLQVLKTEFEGQLNEHHVLFQSHYRILLSFLERWCGSLYEDVPPPNRAKEVKIPSAFSTTVIILGDCSGNLKPSVSSMVGPLGPDPVI